MQAKENDRQRRYGKVWDTVLSDSEMGNSTEIARIAGLKYSLAIESVLKQVQVVSEAVL